jgi:hypothetical protein
MIHWNMFTGATHWMGYDQNGPFASQGLAYAYTGTAFTQWGTYAGTVNGVFCLRACAFVFGEDKMVTLGPQPTPQLSQTPVIAEPGTLSHSPGGSIDSHDYGNPTPDSPNAGTGLIGYNVYHYIGGNDIFDHYVPGPDSLSTYCFNQNPGLQCYDVKAKYDLTTYGFPGTFGESLAETPGPVCVDLSFGYPLPFLEPWDGGSLGYQQWTNGSNWSYTPAFGNPAPSANFTWQPILANYTSSLTSPTINASPWTCATIWFDFDYKLDDRDANGTEMMDIDVMWNNKWTNKKELKNNGSVDWTSEHIDISGAKGQGFQVRFRANGTNTQHILNWYVDNIHLYGVCARPVSLNNTQSHDTINLTWTPPTCGPSGQVMCFIFDDGTMENGWAYITGVSVWLGNQFPLAASVTGSLQTFDLLWWNNTAATNQPFQIDVYSLAGVLLGSSQTFSVPIPAPTTFMTVTLTNEIPFTGPFYGMLHWNMFTGSTHWLGYDENGPFASQALGYAYDGTTFTQWGTYAGTAQGVFCVRACAFVQSEDKVVRLGPAEVPGTTPVIAAPGTLLHSPGGSIDSQDHTTMNYLTDNNGADSSLLIGYNVFRYDDNAAGIIDFHKLNATVQSATSYMDVIGLDTMKYGTYKYYVTAVFNNSQTGAWLCESPGSDTVTIQFPAVGISQITGGTIMIYPNPANDVVNVKSDFDISKIDVLNFIGQTVYSTTVNAKIVKINTSSLQAGVYFVRVTTSKGIRTVKITIVR